MLNRAVKEETQKILKELLKFPEYNVRVASLLKAYGTNYGFFNLWHEEFSNIVAELDENFFVCEGEKTDFSLIKSFLEFMPNVISVGGKKETLEKIGFFRNSKRSFELLALEKNDFSKESLKFEFDTDIRETYRVFSENQSEDIEVGEFSAWYCDVSHRIRHGCAKNYVLKYNGKTAAVLLISAISEKADLVSGIVTEKEFRKKGFGTAILKMAVREINNCEKTAVVECLPKLKPFYEKVGFKKIGEYTIVN